MVEIIRKDYFFGSFFSRGLRSPKVTPISTTTTIRMARAMMPVVSAYTVLEIGVGTAVGMGVYVGGGVGIKGPLSVGGGTREEGSGVGVGPGGGKSTIEVGVGGRVPTAEGVSVFWAKFSKTVAA